MVAQQEETDNGMEIKIFLHSLNDGSQPLQNWESLWFHFQNHLCQIFWTMSLWSYEAIKASKIKADFLIDLWKASFHDFNF